MRIRDGFEELCHTIDIRNPWDAEHDDVTLEEFIKQHGAGEKAMATLSIWTRAMLGCEPSELSALYFLDYCKSGGGLLQMRSDEKNGGQYLRIRTGECSDRVAAFVQVLTEIQGPSRFLRSLQRVWCRAP